MGIEAIVKAAQKRVALDAAVGLLTKSAEPKGKKVRVGSRKGGKSEPASKAKKGTGGRFKAMVGKLKKQKGVRDPEALAGAINRSKYGAKGASARVALKLVKAARAGGIEKQALIAQLGGKLMQYGGAGLRGLGSILQRLGLKGGAGMLRGAGTKLRGLGIKGRRLANMQAAHTGAKKGLEEASKAISAGGAAAAGKSPTMRVAQTESLLRRAQTPTAERGRSIAELVGVGGLGLGGLGALSALGGGGRERPQLPPELLLALAQARAGQGAA